VPLPSAEPAELMMIPSSALQQIAPQQRYLNPVPAGAMRTYIPGVEKWRRTAASHPAVVSVWPRYQEFTAWLRLPDIRCLTPVLYSAEDLLPRKLAGPVFLPRVRPVESMPLAKAAEPAAMRAMTAAALPSLKLAVTEIERVAATENAPVMEV